MNTKNYIGEQIKKRRKFLKLTQDDLAEISDISVRSLKAVEKGEGNPGLRQLIKLLDTLGLEIKVGIRQ